jgi:hypothetical protein
MKGSYLFVLVFGLFVIACGQSRHQDPIPHPYADRFSSFAFEYLDYVGNQAQGPRGGIRPLVVSELEGEETATLFWGEERYPAPPRLDDVWLLTPKYPEPYELFYRAETFDGEQRYAFVQWGHRDPIMFTHIIGEIRFSTTNAEYRMRSDFCRSCYATVQGKPLYVGLKWNPRTFHVMWGEECIGVYNNNPTQPLYADVDGYEEPQPTFFVKKAEGVYVYVVGRTEYAVNIPAPASLDQ